MVRNMSLYSLSAAVEAVPCDGQTRLADVLEFASIFLKKGDAYHWKGCLVLSFYSQNSKHHDREEYRVGGRRRLLLLL